MASSPTPWTIRPHLPDAHFEVVADAAGNTVGTATRREDAALIVEAVNGRQSDEALIASLLYLLAEDYSELFATNRYRHVMETACKRLGIPYEPFGHDALPAITKHMEEYK